MTFFIYIIDILLLFIVIFNLIKIIEGFDVCLQKGEVAEDVGIDALRLAALQGL